MTGTERRCDWDEPHPDTDVTLVYGAHGEEHNDAIVLREVLLKGTGSPRVTRRFEIGDPAKVAKVGDTPADLHEGKNAGCGLIIGVTEGTHTREQLQPHPHTHLIPSVRELPPILHALGQ